MENNNQDKKRIPKIVPPRGPKFNIYWVYGIIALFLLGINFFPFSKSPKLVSFEEVNQTMLQTEDIEKLVVVNKEYVEVFIKPDRISEEKYKDVANEKENYIEYMNSLNQMDDRVAQVSKKNAVKSTKVYLKNLKIFQTS